MRILHVAPCYAPAWAYGGPVRAVTGLTSELARRGHEVAVLATDGFVGEGQPGLSDPSGVTVRRYRVASQGLARAGRLFVAPGLDMAVHAAVRRAEIVHVHEHRTLQAISTALACRAAGVPYVLSPHGSLPVVLQHRGAKRVFDALFGERVLGGASGFIAVSEQERQQLRAHGIEERRIRTIPNGLDEETFESTLTPGGFRARHALGDAEIVLYVGRIHAQKGLATLLRAFALLRERRRDAVLVVAGPDDGYAGELAAVVSRFGMGPRVRLLGPLYGEEKLRAYGDADVLAYPSTYEIFGLVPLEAIARGTPAVVCEGTGAAEIVARVGAGIAVPGGDYGALAAGIGRVLDSPELARRSVTNRERVREMYGWPAVTAQVEDFYAHCLGGARRGRSARDPGGSGRRPVRAA